MVLQTSSWRDVEQFDREAVCLIPTGSLEQHGPHLPLFTDTLLVTAVAERAEKARPDRTLLFPGIWLGCSAHHMAMPGSLTASFETYIAVIRDVVHSAIYHGFRKFLLLNGHGGNTEPNGLALRDLKAKHPNHVFAHCGYFSLIAEEVKASMKGPTKEVRHACEAETSMMLFLFPELVRRDKLRDDGLHPQPPDPPGLCYIRHFDEVSEEGSIGYATFASEETGRLLIEAAASATASAIDHIYREQVLLPINS